MIFKFIPKIVSNTFSCFEISPLMCILLMFLANVCGLIGFSKCWFNSIFGINKNYVNFNLSDLTSYSLAKDKHFTLCSSSFLFNCFFVKLFLIFSLFLSFICNSLTF
jgi:hypothetical protein